MPRFNVLTLSFTATLLGLGCGSDSLSYTCGAVNVTQACVCPGAAAGAQACGEDGAWTACVCADESQDISLVDTGSPDTDSSDTSDVDSSIGDIETGTDAADPPVDCELSEWTEWSDCSEECDGGMQQRTRSVIVAPANGGEACEDLNRTKACNETPCFMVQFSAITLRDEPLRGLTVQGQDFDSSTPIVLRPEMNRWRMLANGAIVLEDDETLGLRAQNHAFEDGSPVFLHTEMSQWQVLENGHIVLKDHPESGLTAVHVNEFENGTQLVLHQDDDVWNW